MKVSQQIGSRHFTIEEIATGVYAAIAIEGTGSIGNAGIVDLGDSTLIFDTFNTQQAAEELKKTAESVTGKPVQYVINSHWHGDHIRGNQVFASSQIISSAKTFQLMSELLPGRIQRQKAMLPQLDENLASLKKKIAMETDPTIIEELSLQLSFLTEMGLSLPDLQLTLPNLTFESSMTFHGSSRQVQVIALGAAHTQCDSILFLPDEQIAFAADIIAIENHPSLMDGDPDNWVHVLNRVGEMDLATIVPGHGPVGGIDAVQVMNRYLQDLTDRVEQLIRQGSSIELISTIEKPDYCRGWKAENLYTQNLRFLFERELSKW